MLQADSQNLTQLMLEKREDAVLQNAQRFLTAAVDLKRWWETEGHSVERFDLARSFNRPGEAFGFFGNARLSDRTDVAVMGSVQEMFYDSPKILATMEGEAAAWMQKQIREFVLHYFMRVSSFRDPEPYVDSHAGSSGKPGRLSWCPQPRAAKQGFGFSQLYYKNAEDGRVGRFPDQDRFAIVDLREIGPRYEWIIVKVRIFDFDISADLGGAIGPELVFRLHEESYLIITREFIRDKSRPRAGILGEYGLGYAFIKSPSQELFAYGPGQFDVALELIQFDVLENGTVNVRMLFLANRPEKIVNLNLNPVQWSLRIGDFLSLGTISRFFPSEMVFLENLPLSHITFDPVYAYVTAINILSGGYAANALCISKTQLDKAFLLQHFTQHYKTIVGSLLTWRQVPDWLDHQALPAWVLTGRSS